MPEPLRKHRVGDALEVPERRAAVAELMGVVVRDLPEHTGAGHAATEPLRRNRREQPAAGGAVLQRAALLELAHQPARHRCPADLPALLIEAEPAAAHVYDTP